MHSHGYVFIMDMQGNLLSHPVLKGHNILNVPDAKTGVLMVRNTVESIQKPAQKTVPKALKVWSNTIFAIPAARRSTHGCCTIGMSQEADWFVGVVTNLDELNEPVTVIRNTLLRSCLARYWLR